ncbi:hypothetical protein [Desulfovibrio sp. JC022]|uniref:hypothetical protein n=1 Tax=Desulfovibrio sp. JC022 TaxID=2593642 RepID=UPI0013D01943|nr:hypothetical protein [Desulfovibrio sp. JC022]NDV24401.1 hypothetical protein [Desulfovibrio sp. JC022]
MSIKNLKPVFNGWAVLVLGMLLFVCAVRPVSAEQVVTIATGEWPPYTGRNLPANGLCAEIVTEAFRVEGVKCRYKFYPWKRVLYMIKSGMAICSVPWSEKILDKYVAM